MNFETLVYKMNYLNFIQMKFIELNLGSTYHYCQYCRNFLGDAHTRSGTKLEEDVEVAQE